MLAAALAALAMLALPAIAGAHPLGNFTINRSAGVELSGSRLYVSYVLDLAEIPTFQDSQSGVGADAYLRRIEHGLDLRVDGDRMVLAPVSRRLAHPRGQGGLHTTRVEVLFAGPLLHGTARVRLRDRTYANRIGWKEVVVAASHGGSVLSSSVPDTSPSKRLGAYPRNLLQSPLDVTEARASLAPAAQPGPPPPLSSRAMLQAPDRVADHGFTTLVSRGRLSLGIVFLSLLLASFWGAVHALTPGHGKAMVTAYLVGSRGTPRHAFLLGGTVTVAHTAGVFALGFVTLALSQVVVPERLYPWLTLGSGVLVVVVGTSVLRSRVRSGRSTHEHQHHHHHHHHDHGHSHAADHDRASNPRGILGVGVAAGLLPCPSALVVLLSAIALHRVWLGLGLILAFSVGLAATISGIGLVAVLARRVFGRVSLDGPLVRLLPAVSAGLILVVGVVLTVRALPAVL